MANLFTSLPLLQKLFPNPLEPLLPSLPLLQKLFPNPLEPLLPAASLKNKGEMTLAQRKQHTEKAGSEWFSTGELDLMLSIFACDGRYEDAVFILPVSVSNILKDGVFAHAQYKALLKLEKDNASMDKKEREDMIVEMFGANLEKIQKLQEQQQNYVLNKIIDQNPGLLSRKVLVFPHNKEQMHWSVTFVFNAGFVCEKLDNSDNSIPSLQPCFFSVLQFRARWDTQCSS